MWDILRRFQEIAGNVKSIPQISGNLQNSHRKHDNIYFGNVPSNKIVLRNPCAITYTRVFHVCNRGSYYF